MIPTEAALDIIEQARKIITEKNVIHEMVQTKKGRLSGELRIGIIATLAPYLLPLFIKSFTGKYPGVKLIVNEMMTEFIVQRLREGRIDAGLLVTPLQEKGIREQQQLFLSVMRESIAFLRNHDELPYSLPAWVRVF